MQRTSAACQLYRGALLQTTCSTRVLKFEAVLLQVTAVDDHGYVSRRLPGKYSSVAKSPTSCTQFGICGRCAP